jgi:hypothetical protein
MHYKNGREAKNGDPVVSVPTHGVKVVSGILYDAVPGNDHCNGRLAAIRNDDPIANLSECLHIDDASSILNETKASLMEAPKVGD